MNDVAVNARPPSQAGEVTLCICCIAVLLYRRLPLSAYRGEAQPPQSPAVKDHVKHSIMKSTDKNIIKSYTLKTRLSLSV